MVKAVLGDEAQLKSLEDLLLQSKPSSSQVGLVVGKLSPGSDRGFVYALVPTPPTEAGIPACSLKPDAGGGGREEKKKGAGSKGGRASTESLPALAIDGDWVAEHARQVSRMLLGGMSVVGIYIWAPEASFKATPSAVLAQVLRGVAQAAPWYDTQLNERLLIHISYSPRRWACRTCNLASGHLQPCDFKFSKLLSSLQAFRCMYNFQIRLPIVQAGPSDSNGHKNVICKGISHLANELQSARALIDGNLVGEELCMNSDNTHEVELLLPFKEDVPAKECNLEEVAGLVVFTGSICSSSYLGPKESVSQAILDLKGDIISSLRSRLDIIIDEAEDAASSANNTNKECGDSSFGKAIHEPTLHQLRKNYQLSFPRRVLVPWLPGIYICDYLQQSETYKDTKDRCREMMSIEMPPETSQILELETAAANMAVKSFWDVAGRDSTLAVDELKIGESSRGQTNTKKSPGTNLNIVAAMFILLLALILGLGFTLSGSLGAAP